MMHYRSYAHLLAALDPIADDAGGYLAYPISLSEYVGTLRGYDRQDAVAWLQERGYARHRFLRAAKFHPDPHGAVDHGSFRRVPDQHPDAVLSPTNDRPPIGTDYAPVECQYHVHLWPTTDGVELFSHYERRGDPFPVGSESVLAGLRRARDHYRDAERGAYYLQGVTDLVIE